MHYIFQEIRTKNDVNGNSRRMIVVYEIGDAVLAVARIKVENYYNAYETFFQWAKSQKNILNVGKVQWRQLDTVTVSPRDFQYHLKASVAEMPK